MNLILFRQECGEELSLEADIKTHLKNDHDLEFEGLEKVVDPEYETTETEVLTEDIRHTEIIIFCLVYLIRYLAIEN